VIAEKVTREERHGGTETQRVIKGKIEGREEAESLLHRRNFFITLIALSGVKYKFQIP